MNVYWDIHGVKKCQNRVITVGTFDGVHLGHHFIIDNLKSRADTLDAETTLVTFDTHPQIVLKSSDKPGLGLLTTIEEKIEILRKFQIDNVVVIRFTKEFSNTSSHDFVKHILFEKIGFREIVIGYDHGFGKNRGGDVRTLVTLGKELGFTVKQLPAFTMNGERVSSTTIRLSIKQGTVRKARSLLGRPYSFAGVVVRGAGRGRQLNFPTANLEPLSKDKLIPGDGVYAVYAHISDEKLNGMMNIGNRPTFDSLQHTLEVHIFDFDQEIYNEKIKLEFADKIRDEIQFANSVELMSQLEKDKEQSLRIL